MIERRDLEIFSYLTLWIDFSHPFLTGRIFWFFSFMFCCFRLVALFLFVCRPPPVLDRCISSTIGNAGSTRKCISWFIRLWHPLVRIRIRLWPAVSQTFHHPARVCDVLLHLFITLAVRASVYRCPSFFPAAGSWKASLVYSSVSYCPLKVVKVSQPPVCSDFRGYCWLFLWRSSEAPPPYLISRLSIIVSHVYHLVYVLVLVCSSP